jgi:hypothetical protein
MLIATRISGDHLHLCFDGSEPPVSLHGIDTGDHHADDGIEHDDSEVDLPGFTLSKAKSDFHDAALVQAAVWRLAELPRLAIPLDTGEPHRRLTTPYLLKPPSRGPPASLHA